MTTQLRVLVADDHAIHRTLLQTLFECFGCSVTVVTNGAEALAAEGGFDLICLDRNMPVMGGPAAAAAMGGAGFMVACTSDPTGDLCDFHMVIPKPVSCEDIARAIAAARTWRSCCGALDWRARDAIDVGRRIAALLLSSPELAADVRELLARAAARSAGVRPTSKPRRLVA